MSTHTHRAGFTLIELIVVMAIMATVVGIGLPRLLTWHSHGNLGAESRRLAGMILYARAEAARQQRPFYVTMDLGTHAYWIEVRRDPGEIEDPGYFVSGWDLAEDEYQEYENDYVGRQELRRRLMFDFVEGADGGKDNFGKARLEFRPDGTSDTAAIYFIADDGRQATVIVNGQTGQVEVYDYFEALEPLPELREQYDLDDE
ncbi:MAG: GspH/FimT family pseudopilin [Verrucomicrobia bacterium]|nr:GspH/FimT family pseudopilin [Verrucomicrobiota bacterium]